MQRTILLFLLSIFILIQPTQAQRTEEDSPYEVIEALEIPLAIVGAGSTAYGFYLLNQKSGSDSLTIANLNINEDVIKFNRHGEPRYSEKASKQSDLLFYGSFPIPFLMLLDKNIRRDAGRISIMYVEALGLTGTIYSMTASHVDKYRPLAYSPDAPMSERMSSKAKNSFYGGHPTITATSLFFVAKVVSDYYPDRKGLHWVLYTAASVATLGNAYLRYRAGKHFLTDLMIGIPIGTLNGILVPQIHKVKNVNMDKINKLSWKVFTGQAHGISLAYKL
ncbi:phosphatase PAP2 family protein [Fulvivirga ligni]|uniref:phosphatase PAP2 family protein n=1 Tax=Fulvivirga ligni TaxID=2904246 RepID=UPI001F328613|nr:phosphatase PAP2 family protein [Fulvivirga ligni]UII20035.1 phosphatase PAP2 family protein [Fulvivirga ligni]